MVDVLISGVAVDTRGREVINSLEKLAKEKILLQFEPKGNRILVDGEEIRNQRFLDRLRNKSVRIETTTLGLAEILLTLRALNDVGIFRCEFIYLEPGEYVNNAEPSRTDFNPNFSLTQNCDFRAIPGFAQAYEDNDPAVHVYFLGYEKSRLLKAVEQRDSVDPNRYIRHVVIGVPSFEAGWENNVFSSHATYLDQINVNESRIDYCPANSAQEAYLLLWGLYKNYGNERRTFFVSPLGTKPHGVGAAMFLLETRGATYPTSFYYDNPVRMKERSREIAAWHHITANWNSSI
jgi:hypothetical protein